MGIFDTKLGKRIWTRALGSHSWSRRYGSFRDRERHGLVYRPNYAYGMLRAADVAKFFGHDEVTVCEFGVATGNGLMNMVELSKIIQAETGIRFRIYGFDTGAGLPAPVGHKDHPELWNPGDFPMGDVAALKSRIGESANLVIGDIADTIGSFTQSLSSKAPLGFVSIDVDIYSGTVSALKCLESVPEAYLPAISFYFDDVSSFFSNSASGELCAIAEYNEAHSNRPIDIDRSLPGRRVDPADGFYSHMYTCHVLDHPARTMPRPRGSMSLADHMAMMAGLN